MTGGVRAPHDVDRALTELLQEIRIAQMGGQIGLGFLLAVAYTSVIQGAGEADRTLYAWAVGVTTTAVVLLFAPVPLHRLNFGRRSRGQILVVGHVLGMAGLAVLGVAIVLSVWLAARIALPGSVGPLVVWSAALVVATWLVVPLVLRFRRRDAVAPTNGRGEVDGQLRLDVPTWPVASGRPEG